MHVRRRRRLLECDSCHLSTQRLSNRDYLLMRLASSDLAFINIYICIHIYILYLPTSLQRCLFTLVSYLSFSNLSTNAVCSLLVAQLSWFVLPLYILNLFYTQHKNPSVFTSIVYDYVSTSFRLCPEFRCTYKITFGRGTLLAAHKQYRSAYELCIRELPIPCSIL